MLFLCPDEVVSQTRYVEARRAAGLHPINEVQRFRLLFAALCCSICISMIYVFDLFTKDFKEMFKLTAGDMATVSTIGMCVCWFVLPYGFIFNHVGPAPLFLLALVIGTTGSLCLALVFRGTIHGSIATISVFYAMICSSSGLLDSASIVTLAEVFPRNRGPVIGLAKVMTGLGSSILSSLNSNLFRNNVSAFLFFIMALVVCVSISAVVIMRLPPYQITPWRRQRMDPAKVPEMEALKSLYHRKSAPFRRLAVAFAIVAAFIVFFTVSTPVKAYVKTSRASQTALGVITICIFLCFIVITLPIPWLGGVREPAPLESLAASPVQAAATEEKQLVTGITDAAVEPGESPTEALAEADELRAAESDEGESAPPAAPARSRQDPRYGGSLKHNLLKPDVWLLIFGFTFQSAIGNMVLYNGSTISVALNGTQRTAELSALYTAFLGVGSACGRIAMGLFEAYVQGQNPEKKRRVLVTIALPLPPVLAVIACVLLLVLPGKAVLLPYIIVYFEEGFFNAIRAIIYPCLFESHHPVYYNMSFMSSILSIVCFNRLLFGYVVDQEHNRLGYAAGEDCKERQCVRTPIIVACCVAALAAGMQAIVHWRYSRFVAAARDSLETVAHQQEDATADAANPQVTDLDAMEIEEAAVREKNTALSEGATKKKKRRWRK